MVRGHSSSSGSESRSASAGSQSGETGEGANPGGSARESVASSSSSSQSSASASEDTRGGDSSRASQRSSKDENQEPQLCEKEAACSPAPVRADTSSRRGSASSGSSRRGSSSSSSSSSADASGTEDCQSATSSAGGGQAVAAPVGAILETTEQHLQRHAYPIHARDCDRCRYVHNRALWEEDATFTDPRSGGARVWLTEQPLPLRKPWHLGCVICMQAKTGGRFGKCRAGAKLSNIQRHATSRVHMKALQQLSLGHVQAAASASQGPSIAVWFDGFVFVLRNRTGFSFLAGCPAQVLRALPSPTSSSKGR